MAALALAEPGALAGLIDDALQEVAVLGNAGMYHLRADLPLQDHAQADPDDAAVEWKREGALQSLAADHARTDSAAGERDIVHRIRADPGARLDPTELQRAYEHYVHIAEQLKAWDAHIQGLADDASAAEGVGPRATAQLQRLAEEEAARWAAEVSEIAADFEVLHRKFTALGDDLTPGGNTRDVNGTAVDHF
mmetsp:Transcript_26823/g.89810  ORF Transcript_26823/g.89810 Transcript_26823/m.89810 type:complete len:193 (+) Transcript_26823:420-998(+)